MRGDVAPPALIGVPEVKTPMGSGVDATPRPLHVNFDA